MKMTLSPSETGNMSFENGTFSMFGDGIANTEGDQNVVMDYMLGDGPTLLAFAPSGDASMSLAGMVAAAPPSNNGSFIMQTFDEGDLFVYGVDNTMLLSAKLTKSGLQGALGPGDKQGLFLAFGEVTGGSLGDLLEPDSLQLRIKFPKIADGFSVTDSQLDSFTTWTPTVEIMATPVVVPEPSVALPLCAAAWWFVSARRRRR
jgi:hypothetical protein